MNISNNLVASQRHQSCGFSAFNSHAKECFPKNISLKSFTTENHSKEQFEMSGVSDKLPILANEEPPPYSSNIGELGKGQDSVDSTEVKVFTRRWYILGIFSVLACHQVSLCLVCHHQQGPTGSFFEYWGGFGSCNEKSHVAGAFLSGKNVGIFIWVFPGTLSSLGYFWHYLYFGRGEPNDLESYT